MDRSPNLSFTSPGTELWRLLLLFYYGNGLRYRLDDTQSIQKCWSIYEHIAWGFKELLQNMCVHTVEYNIKYKSYTRIVGLRKK